MSQWRQKRGHANYYNKIARAYDACYAEEQRLKIEMTLRHLKLRSQSAIVDLGGGTGLLLPWIAEKAKSVVCLDLSKAMLREVDHSIRISPNIHLIRADADYAPLAPSQFDVAFAITLLQNMPHPTQTLREMWRITQPDAQLVVTGLKKRFTRRAFSSLLKEAGLVSQLLDAEEKLKCHIALCKKRR